jgi:hypothetical protein
LESQDHIIVNLTDLYKTIRQMRKDDMYLVDLMILPPGEDDGEAYPASLNIGGISSSDMSCLVDYDSLDAVEVDSPSTFMSSNLNE